MFICVMRPVALLLLVGFGGFAAAQSSASFELDESVFHAGGHPQAGLQLTSTSYLITVDAIGETLVAPAMQSRTHAMDPGFARSYPPPRDVIQVVLHGDKETISWAPERSVGKYRVYRGDLDLLPVDYGVCRVSDVNGEQAPVDEYPDPGDAYFYLVTAESRLLEEGSKGLDSSGALRANPAPCP